MRLLLGAPAPMFTAPTLTSPTFALGSTAGRFVLLGFLPTDRQARGEVLGQLAANRSLFTDAALTAFLVTPGVEDLPEARDGVGLRWFLDPDGAVRRLYGALDADGREHAVWVLLDPMLRVYALAPMHRTEAFMARLRALPAPEDNARVAVHAPVLIVPRIFEPTLCRAMIEHYERRGGSPSGVMRDVGGRTVGVLDDFKKRRDAPVDDERLLQAMRTAIAHRLLPEVQRAFQFAATRVERYIVACYDAAEGGYFRPHRDNTTAGTAHRKFAVSINLNAEDYEGGDLRFPEFGSRTYRAPTGGAVVFSCSLLHEATPVTRGRRYASLPFLYDEAGARVREQNRHLLQSDPPPPPVAAPVPAGEAVT